jgi:hypothetical protein
VESSTGLGGFRALKKTPEAPYTTKVNYRDHTSRGTTQDEMRICHRFFFVLGADSCELLHPIHQKRSYTLPPGKRGRSPM